MLTGPTYRYEAAAIILTPCPYDPITYRYEAAVEAEKARELKAFKSRQAADEGKRGATPLPRTLQMWGPEEMWGLEEIPY